MRHMRPEKDPKGHFQFGFIAKSPRSDPYPRPHKPLLPELPHRPNSFSLSNLKCSDQLPRISRSLRVKCIIDSKVFASCRCSKKAGVIKKKKKKKESSIQRRSINTTTCSAGTGRYLLLNGLIGSEGGGGGDFFQTSMWRRKKTLSQREHVSLSVTKGQLLSLSTSSLFFSFFQGLGGRGGAK